MKKIIAISFALMLCMANLSVAASPPDKDVGVTKVEKVGLNVTANFGFGQEKTTVAFSFGQKFLDYVFCEADYSELVSLNCYKQDCIFPVATKTTESIVNKSESFCRLAYNRRVENFSYSYTIYKSNKNFDFPVANKLFLDCIKQCMGDAVVTA